MPENRCSASPTVAFISDLPFGSVNSLVSEFAGVSFLASLISAIQVLAEVPLAAKVDKI